MIEYIHLFSHKLLKGFVFSILASRTKAPIKFRFKCRSILDFGNYRSRTEVAAFRRDAICFARTSEASGRCRLILIPLRPRQCPGLFQRLRAGQPIRLQLPTWHIIPVEEHGCPAIRKANS